MKRLDTGSHRVAKPSTFMVTRGVLKGYVKCPMALLIASKLTFKKYRKQIELDLPADFIDDYAFLAWLYLRMQNKMEKGKAFETLRAGILCSGLAQQQASFRNVECPRSFENLVKYQQLNNKEGNTKLNTMKVIEQSERKYEIRVSRCMFFELFTYLEVPELTSIFCAVDNAIFNTYLPEELIFHRNGLNRTMAQGYKHCEFVIENKT